SRTSRSRGRDGGRENGREAMPRKGRVSTILQALENLRQQQASALAYFDVFLMFAVVMLMTSCCAATGSPVCCRKIPRACAREALTAALKGSRDSPSRRV